jgi:hypothetical protein
LLARTNQFSVTNLIWPARSLEFTPQPRELSTRLPPRTSSPFGLQPINPGHLFSISSTNSSTSNQRHETHLHSTANIQNSPSSFPQTKHPPCPQGRFPTPPIFFPGPVALNTSNFLVCFVFARHTTKRQLERSWVDLREATDWFCEGSGEKYARLVAER